MTVVDTPGAIDISVKHRTDFFSFLFITDSIRYVLSSISCYSTKLYCVIVSSLSASRYLQLSVIKCALLLPPPPKKKGSTFSYRHDEEG